MRPHLMPTTLAVLIAVIAARPATAEADKPRRIEIAVTKAGFEPAKLRVKKGEPVTLVFTRKTDKTCAKEVIVKLGDDKTIKADLPIDRAVELNATFAKSGELSYACGMNMVSGVVVVQ